MTRLSAETLAKLREGATFDRDIRDPWTIIKPTDLLALLDMVESGGRATAAEAKLNVANDAVVMAKKWLDVILDLK